jgi:hypothetical protein
MCMYVHVYADHIHECWLCLDALSGVVVEAPVYTHACACLCMYTQIVYMNSGTLSYGLILMVRFQCVCKSIYVCM